MSQHLTISPSEAADRLAIRELIEAYAHCADRRDAKGQMSLFTSDTHFVVYMNARDPKASVPLATSRRRICWPDTSGRFTLNGTGSWQRLGGSASSVASKRRRYELIYARR